jgi:hypothetical protein
MLIKLKTRVALLDLACAILRREEKRREKKRREKSAHSQTPHFTTPTSEKPSWHVSELLAGNVQKWEMRFKGSEEGGESESESERVRE